MHQLYASEVKIALLQGHQTEVALASQSSSEGRSKTMLSGYDTSDTLQQAYSKNRHAPSVNLSNSCRAASMKSFQGKGPPWQSKHATVSTEAFLAHNV